MNLGNNSQMYADSPETYDLAGLTPAQQDAPVKKRISLTNLSNKRPAPEDFTQPKPGIYGSPFRPSFGANGELMPAIVPADVVAAPVVRTTRLKPLAATRCKKGHELTPDNTIVVEYKNGGYAPKRRLKCKICAEAIAVAKDYCKYGHPRTPENRYYHQGKPSGCLACRNAKKKQLVASG